MRAGQGGVTAAQTFAEATFGEGKHIHASPEDVPECAGASMRAFNRVSDVPIRLYGTVQRPAIVVGVGPTLRTSKGALDGTDGKSVLPVNTPLIHAEVRTSRHIQGRPVFTVDATKIALE